MRFLPLVGLVAFYFDSSFLDLRKFFPQLNPDSVDTIYLVSSIGCIIAAIGLLYVIQRNLKANLKSFRNIKLFNLAAIISQSIIIGIIIATLFQYYKDDTYSFSFITILFILSYSVSLFFMGLLVVRFFSWYSYEKETVVLGYAAAICIVIIFLVSSIAYAAYELSFNVNPYKDSKDLTVQVSGKNPYPNIFSTHFYYSYILTFISIWIATMLFLRAHLGKRKSILFYFLFVIPLLYFLIPLIPQFSSYLAKLVVQSPDLYGTIYVIFFSGTGPVGGVIFSVVLLIFAKTVNDQQIRSYLLISALGMLLFFIANQDPPLVENLNPPFGIISKSFVGLSCYMIFLGFYATVIYLTRKDTVTHAVLKQMSRDKLFGSLVRSEQERQVSSIISKSMDILQNYRVIESKEMSVEDIENLVMVVRKEMSTMKGEDENTRS